jgi:hypothetical protein
VTLVNQDDVEASLLRPLTTAEAAYIAAVIAQAEAKLRVKLPTVDELVEAYALVPRPERSLNPAAVAAMLAAVIKRRFVNPKGLWSSTESEGDYSIAETYPSPRAGAAAAASPGDLEITDADLASLFPNRLETIGSLRLGRPDLHWCVR